MRRRLAGGGDEVAIGDAAWAADAVHVPAAVLVGIVPGEHGGVLLTKRHTGLRRHPGQVAFPGGRIDPGDASHEAAALREAGEEVGLAPAAVECVGRLPDYVTVTGYRVTPVTALLASDLRLTVSPAEVETAFLLPLRTLLDPAAPERRQAAFRGEMREFWVWPHAEHTVWGATAAMLMELARRLRG